MNTIISHKLSAWLTLHFVPRFTPKCWQRCLLSFPSPAAFCTQSEKRLQAQGFCEETVKAIKQPNWAAIEKAIAWSEQPNQSILTCECPQYPHLLKQIVAAPPLLYVRGDINTLNHPQIAIVGTRKPSTNATQLARYFAKKLGDAGFTITSGLALGIDAAAHEGAIVNNKPTIAVLGNGLETIYPLKNRNFADKILENGAIISEFPLEEQPKPANFPRRNRIISGLSLGVLVVEAALKSGSLITARYALEQNREVFATPGSLLNSLSAGCHHLIKQGAALVSSVDDILSEIPLSNTQKILKEKAREQLSFALETVDLSEEHKKLLNCINFDIISFEQIVDKSGFSIQKVTSLLCELTLNGYIREESGSFVRVVS